MKIAYFDCFSGASGDMILGALVDAGLDIAYLQAELGRLSLPPFQLEARKVLKRGLSGTQVLISFAEEPARPQHQHQHPHHHHHHHHQEPHHHHPGHHHHGPHAHHQVHDHAPGRPHRQTHQHRHLGEIRAIIQHSDLPQAVKDTSLTIFSRLAQAEAKVHRTSIDKIHFHEVGAMDAIIDIVGAAIGFHALGLEKIFCSPLHVGTGTVECAHGILPVPAPATLELVQGKPIYSTGVSGELLTPTGAAILTTVAAGFGPLPPCRVAAIGYGAGTIDLPLPNLLRLTIGESTAWAEPHLREQVVVLEANVTGEPSLLGNGFRHQMQVLGALETYLVPTKVSSEQDGLLITVVCPPEAAGQCSEALLATSGGAGIRWRLDHRLLGKEELQPEC